ncbi:hypothetical protein G6F56_010589 [Rhizopus delemar]|nr:hypothetical protein G6F56_010589 [Rhizopus delemar]
MHGLFLGTAKRMVKIWRTTFNNDTNSVYLTDSDLVEMQVEADQIILPQQYTPIRRKIGSKFSDMKADEWRTWCLAYSPYLLKGRLPVSHKNNWALFVQACHIVCRPSVTIADAWSAHKLFQEFAIGVARLYGKNAVSPNMHLHLHLLESIRDFGPIYSFWVYGFERFNGDIKKIRVNHKSSFEVTYMKKFLQVVHFGDYVRSLPMEIQQNSIMMGVLNKLTHDTSSFTPLASNHNFDFSAFVSASISDHRGFNGSEVLPPSTYLSMEGKASKYMMQGAEYGALLDFYKGVYMDRGLLDAFDFSYFDQMSTTVIPAVSRYADIDILGQVYRSKDSNASCGCYIQVLFRSDFPGGKDEMRIGEVQYFFSHDLQNSPQVTSNGQIYHPSSFKSHVFAYVRWYMPSLHPFQGFEQLGAYYYHDAFRPVSADCVLPISRIHTCVAMKKEYPDNHIVFLPLPRKTVGL